MSEKVILVDWGTSNFRAFLVDCDSGQCLDRRETDQGLRNLGGESFSSYLHGQVADWRLNASLPVYLAGMVGAARGWHEAPQPELPQDSTSLALATLPIPGEDATWILPGARQVTPEHVDVMRGEEVQALGALELAGTDSAHLVLPGTHSKWIHAKSGRLLNFTTLMTGELFHAVRFHTLIGEPARDPFNFDADAFELGLEQLEREGGLLHALFEGRSRLLYAGLTPEQLGSYLSGVLIGEEARVMRRAHPALTEVLLVGADRLHAPYRQALAYQGINSLTIDGEAAVRAGMLAIVRQHRTLSATPANTQCD